ncbi:MAG TPA: hypothetical protein VK137_21225, partial [Planctomycetaceae bacterium]|nr:hypothetical protein [Planctomycetaceae bacterium]
MPNSFYTFIGGNTGRWRVCDISPIVGHGIEAVSHIEIANENLRQLPIDAAWCLRGVISNQRYT